MSDRSHTGRGAGQHQVPLGQGEVLGDVTDEVGQGEDHVPRMAGLPGLAVDLAPQADVVRVGDAGQGDEGTDGQTGVEHLGQCPGVAFPLGLLLEVPGRHVEGQAVAPHVAHGLLLRHPLALASYHHTQLDLVVQLRAAQGYFYLLSGSDVG